MMATLKIFTIVLPTSGYVKVLYITEPTSHNTGHSGDNNTVFLIVQNFESI